MTRSRLALTAFLTALAIWVFVYKAAPKMPDFEVYWKVAARAAHAESLYRPSDGHYQFKCLPAFAVLIPLVRMPLATAELVWFATSVALLVTLLALAVRLPVERRKPSAGWSSSLSLRLASSTRKSSCSARSISSSRSSPLPFLAMRSGREVSAGALVALAIVIKPYAVLFLPWLVARRRLPSVVSACVGLAVVLALPAALYGWEGNAALHREWWRTVIETTAPNLSLCDNVSLASMYSAGSAQAPCRRAFALGTAALLLGLVALVFIGRRGIPFPEGIEGAMLLTLMPLLSPQGWHYVFLIATPAIVYASRTTRTFYPVRCVCSRSRRLRRSASACST